MLSAFLTMRLTAVVLGSWCSEAATNTETPKHLFTSQLFIFSKFIWASVDAVLFIHLFPCIIPGRINEL